MSTDSSFWHKVGEQQTSSTVGLGFVTTNVADPSTCYWPGPGLLPPFNLQREWITHHTSVRFASDTQETITGRVGIHFDEFGSGLAHNHKQHKGADDVFRSDILITYKLKNPAQFLRDVFDVAYLDEFYARFATRTTFYLMTGFKVSRNVKSAIDHQNSQDDSMTFELSTKLALPKFLPNQNVGVVHSHVSSGVGHEIISRVRYQAPGDSIFYVRYQPIELPYCQLIRSRVMIIPARPQSWQDWLMGGFVKPHAYTIILPRHALDSDHGLRMLVTTDSVERAVRRMLRLSALQECGRRAPAISGDNIATV